MFNGVSALSQFNDYRKVYSSLTFNELKKQHEQWYRKYPLQSRFEKRFFVNCFKHVVKTLKRNLFVVELGGFEGALALEILKMYPTMQWLNVEIIKHTMKRGLEKYRYTEHVLSEQLWREKLDLRKYDVFVSSHTLEHLSNVQVKRLFEYLILNNMQYLILDIPVRPNGQTWYKYSGTHVLMMGSNHLKKLLISSYVLVFERSTSPQAYEWYSIWRRRRK